MVMLPVPLCMWGGQIKPVVMLPVPLCMWGGGDKTCGYVDCPTV